MLNITVDISINPGEGPTDQEQAILSALTAGAEWPPAPAPAEQKPAPAPAEQKPAPAKKKPGPKPKPKPAEEPSETAEPEKEQPATETPATTTEPDPGSAGPTFDDVRKAAQDALMEKRHDQVRTILKDLGAARVTEIPDDKRAEFMERLNRAD